MRKTNEVKFNNYSGKTAFKKFIKFFIIVLVMVISYFVSAYLYGHKQTLIKLLKLVFYFACGFISFYLLYWIASLITSAVYSIKRKNQAKVVISCDDDVSALMSNADYKFNYNVKFDFKQNANEYKTKLLSLVKAVAIGYNNKICEYYYLDYTVYDALDILSNVVDGLDYKITPIFKFLRAEDKPLKIVEKLLLNAIETSKRTTNLDETHKKSNVIEKIKGTIKKTGFFLIKGVIDSACNDLSTFIAFEAFKVYGKTGKSYDLSVAENKK